MNINSPFTHTPSSYPLFNTPADTQRYASSASHPPESRAEHEVKNPAFYPKAHSADIAGTVELLQRLAGLISSVIANINALLRGLGKPEPQAVVRPVNVDKPEHETRTVKPYTPAQLLDGFVQQRGTMNCVTVAGIKAAMRRFGGPDEVYLSKEPTRDGFTIRMRDNPYKTYHVTHDEIAYATRSSGFTGHNKKMLGEANFMYAVSAKRAEIENNDGYANRGYKEAVRSLDTWEHTAEGLTRLGLANHMQYTTARELINGAPGVMASNDHVVTVLNGRTDDYGNPGYTPHPGAVALKLR